MSFWEAHLNSPTLSAASPGCPSLGPCSMDGHPYALSVQRLLWARTAIPVPYLSVQHLLWAWMAIPVPCPSSASCGPGGHQLPNLVLSVLRELQGHGVAGCRVRPELKRLPMWLSLPHPFICLVLTLSYADGHWS